MSSVKGHSRITMIVNLYVSRDLKKCNRVTILSFRYERQCFTIHKILIPILEGPKNDLIETPPLMLRGRASFSSTMIFVIIL